MKVDFLALAQHYELNTRLIDVTSEPEIAAYFATHQWIDGVPFPVNEGIGCIRELKGPSLLAQDPKFHMIGLQCFQRPGLQAAYGIEMGPDDGLNDKGWCVYFKQNEEASKRIHLNFHIDESKVNTLRESGRTGPWDLPKIESVHSWLFPSEEISDVAKLIKNSKRISQAAVDEYGKDCTEILRRKGVAVSKAPVYSLSEDHRKELEEQYRERPYGDVQLTTKIVYRPIK